MRRVLFSVLACAVVLCVAGCATSPLTVSIKPTLNATKGEVAGHGEAIEVNVVDLRPSKVVGTRRAFIGKEPVAVSTGADFTVSLAQQVGAALVAQGFVPNAAEAKQQRVLTIEIRALEYASPGTPIGGLAKNRAVIRALAQRNKEILEKTYTVENEKPTAFAPTEAGVEEMINATLAQGLDRVINDQELIKQLAK